MAINMDGTPQAPMQAPQEAPRPRGLLGGFFGPEGRDARSRLAIGLEGLAMNPNQALIGQLQQGIETRATASQKNATIGWLRSRGHDDLAAALEAGAPPQEVLAESVRRMQPKDPMEALNLRLAQLKVAEMEKPQPGFRRATPEESAAYGAQAGQFGPDGRFYAEEVAQPEGAYRQVTGAQLGLTGPEAEKIFNLSPEGQVTAIGGAGPSTTVNVGGKDSTSALNTKLAEAEGTLLSTYLQQGPIASAALQDLSLLQEILPMAPQGPIVGRAAELFPGFSSAGAAATSVIKRVAPTLRVEGSGSSSDIEYNGMLQSLPSLQNYPEANTAIVNMMQAKAQINRERSELVRAYQNSAKTEEDAAALRARLSELDSRSIMTPELRAIINQLGGAPQGGAGGGAGQPTMTPEQAARILLEAP